ncbi:MAG: hypothetical protein QOI14_1724, partial [Actinomycetota bacterium]|nr:hypothetical protein [Actinomycetota bacterium]
MGSTFSVVVKQDSMSQSSMKHSSTNQDSNSMKIPSKPERHLSLRRQR